MSNVKFIKILVFLLTFAIFFGLALMVGLLTGKVKKKNINIEETISLNQPLGSNIKNVLTKDNYLYVVISGGNIADRIVIFDTKSGKVISNIGLN